MTPKPVVLMILDGFGAREAAPDNAISHARTPTFDQLTKRVPHALLATSGEAVGLPKGQMGNSEVGHMNLGTGRVVYQDFTRIAKAIDEGSFETNAVLVDACRRAREQNGTLHLLGLLSPGGVHSHEDHLEAMITMADSLGVAQVRLHAFLDGRDVPPQSATDSLSRFTRLESVHPNYTLSSLCGRYFAMDRDNNWDRIQPAIDLIVRSQAVFSAGSALEALKEAYRRGETDEFVQPTRLGESWEMRPEDVVLCMNFRSDRGRQIMRAFADPALTEIERPDWLTTVSTVTLTQYSDQLPVQVAFPPQSLAHTLGDVLSEAGKTQLRIAETEKYAHVTFFFSGGREAAQPGETRQLIPSPKIATYDLQPEMSAPEVTDALVDAITTKAYDVIICNFANGDMVGHTGIFEAAVKAIETLDQCVSRVIAACENSGGTCLITADHGNAEQMRDPDTGQPHTAHTVGPVPVWLANPPPGVVALTAGALQDVAPTILDLLSLPVPSAMTGHSLLVRA
ncbi:MAG: 2,3-bisphosphoglycerate-independent phosphoglycerate mutase [Litorivicinaceae bacterium]|mgnify:FL=1|nr:2,3-bisphosphoglycerate-independent phosphoglycerate mutase [Litorivicinaceae bacterium]MDP5328691.1 2,3-bisphosphoglycerate-independent phosphoglycerate mutase [Litorivicinaceae bacterium]MDP5330305.1 2,3-bisphosphoglycerate-independent phosphoglycerate mutase [Litorivicinaceae bacterium]